MFFLSEDAPDLKTKITHYPSQANLNHESDDDSSDDDVLQINDVMTIDSGGNDTKEKKNNQLQKSEDVRDMLFWHFFEPL